VLQGRVSAPHRTDSLAPHPVAAHQTPRSPGPACQSRVPVSLASRRPPLSHGNAAARARRPRADAGRLSHFLPPTSHSLFPVPPSTRRLTFRSPSAASPPPFKRVPPPSPPVFLPSPHRPTLAPLRRAHKLSPPPAEHRRSFEAPRPLAPSTNSIVVPLSPPSLVRTAARMHPSTFLLFGSPFTYPCLSPACRSTPESSPPSRAALHRRTAATQLLPATPPTTYCPAHPLHGDGALTENLAAG
jgi:hypothetical protein